LSWWCTQDIVVVTVMTQSYLVTQDDVRRLNVSQKVFSWIVTALDCAIRRHRWHGLTFDVIQVLAV